MTVHETITQWEKVHEEAILLGLHILIVVEHASNGIELHKFKVYKQNHDAANMVIETFETVSTLEEVSALLRGYSMAYKIGATKTATAPKIQVSIAEPVYSDTKAATVSSSISQSIPFDLKPHLVDLKPYLIEPGLREKS